MTDKELIDKIIALYIDARKTTYLRKNIKRGRSHSISSRVEDLLAIYIAEILSNDSEDLPDNIEILIDQPITYHTDKSYAIYPDIAIIKNGEVVKLFDVKMDLGWNRDFFPFCEEKEMLMNEIKGLKVKAKDGATKEQKVYTISPNIKYNIVIVSNENISPKMRRQNEEQIALIEKNKVEIFVLTEDIHPNHYDEKLSGGIVIRNKDFDSLRNEVKTLG